MILPTLEEEISNKFFKWLLKIYNKMSASSRMLLIAPVMTVFVMIMVAADVSAESNQVIITPINEKISLEKTTTTMSVPQENKLPWGIVRGEGSEYVEKYPVIIQFYKGEDPIHFAQVDVKGDGSYEYKFRVRNMDTNTGEFVNIFEGNYTVKIYRVIPNTNDLT